MLGVDLERVTIAEPCCDVSIVNDKSWYLQIASVKQSALFVEIIKNITYKHKREISVINRLCFLNF